MFRRAGKIRPELVEVQYNLAVALGIAGDDAEAARIYQRILDLDPQNAAARNNYAASLLNCGHAAEALQQYDRLIAQHPGAADAYNNRGMALHYLKRFDEALAAYDRAIGLRPAICRSLRSYRGNVLATLRRADDALASFNKATALKPDFADAYSNAGNIHCDRKAYGEAIAAFDRALALRPDDAETKSMRLYAKMHLCDWSDFAAESADLRASIDRGLPVYPFVALAVSTSPAQQFRCARQFAAKRYPRAPTPLWQGENYDHDRLRIAYLSADFRAHAVSNLMAGLFECHDRAQFEVTALSIGPDDGSTMPAAFAAGFRHLYRWHQPARRRDRGPDPRPGNRHPDRFERLHPGRPGRHSGATGGAGYGNLSRLCRQSRHRLCRLRHRRSHRHSQRAFCELQREAGLAARLLHGQ